ncbi:MAG: hypothetical protein ACI8UR_001372 [Natronomonas sp.]|jgi:hypothetical protein|uniref:DUF7541 family protein n=1 Tax=Natronomonas sp. TaxID=2184060 RepID=UPI0039890382
MEAEPGVSERYEKTSPWPVVVALGFVLSEIGILFNLYPISVGGLLLFVGSVSGIIHEAGYVTEPWRLLSALGIALAAAGVAIVSTQVDGGVSAYVTQVSIQNGITQRGFTIAATGAILALAGVVLPRARNQ